MNNRKKSDIEKENLNYVLSNEHSFYWAFDIKKMAHWLLVLLDVILKLSLNL